MSGEYIGKVAFAIGTGRNGTQFISRLLENEKEVSSIHERNPLNETFHRYCKWHKLKVDHAGFIAEKEQEIRNDLEDYRFSFEASAFLSLSVLELYNAFNAKFVLLLRSPEKVINSYLYKGWYTDDIIIDDTSKAVGYQKTNHFHHFLGRILPKDDKIRKWNEMSRVGRLAWYWSTLNREVLNQFEKLPMTHFKIFKIENFGFTEYKEMLAFLDLDISISEAMYYRVVKDKPHSFLNTPSIEDWNNREIREFKQEIAGMANKLGYSYDVKELIQKNNHKRNSLSIKNRLKKIKRNLL